MRFARNPAVLWRSTSRGPVVLAPADEQPQRLEGLAAVVWEVLDLPLGLPAIEAEAAGIVADLPSIDATVWDLERMTLVVRVP